MGSVPEESMAPRVSLTCSCPTIASNTHPPVTIAPLRDGAQNPKY